MIKVLVGGAVVIGITMMATGVLGAHVPFTLGNFALMAPMFLFAGIGVAAFFKEVFD